MTSGTEPPPPGPVTLRDVARRAGVCMSTASRALSGGSHVRELLVERVRQAASDLDYHPNLIARNLRMQRTMTLGCVVHSLDDRAALEALEVIEEGSRERGYSLAFTTAAGDPAVARLLMQRLLERRVDGIFVYQASGIAEVLPLCKAQGVPVLGVSRSAEDPGDLPVVIYRPGDATATAVRRMYHLGHRSIAYFTDSEEIADVGAVHLAATAEELGMRFRQISIPDGSDDGRLAAMLAAMRALSDMPTGLFTRHRHLHKVLAAIRDAALEVPRDCSLVSYGDAPWLRAVSPPIAVISTPARQLGRLAVDTMMAALEGTSPAPVTYAESPVWVERGSVGSVPRLEATEA
jgi:DNA-binding LacI/PurR family transcriptional regulator